MKRLYLFTALFCFTATIQGQDFDRYNPISSRGALPADFTQRTSDKVDIGINQEVEKKDKRKIKKSKKEFLLESSYALEDLLFSGHILYGDPVTEYVNKVADRVLIARPALRKKLRFYCLNSSSVNAFATNQGMIFVTLGLISELQNEAQLAFVISHEIVHYLNKHVITSKVQMDAMVRGKEAEFQNEDDLIRQLSSYSKAIELEADSVGFEIFEKSGYDLQESNTMFNVLQFQRLPFDEITFNFEKLFDESTILPEGLFLPLDSLRPIDFADDQDDWQSSHPNIATRRSVVERLIDKSREKEENKFLVSEAEFYNVRNISRFECIRNQLKHLDYVEALYNIQVLEKVFPDSYFLQKSTAKALYGITKYRNAGKYGRLVDDYTDYEGQIGAVYFFFEEISALQCNLLAINYCWKLKTLYPDDEYLQLICDDLLREFHYNHKYTLEELEGKLAYVLQSFQEDTLISLENNLSDIELEDSSQTEVIDDFPEIKKIEELGKYEKLALMKEKEEKSGFNVDDKVDDEDAVFIHNLQHMLKDDSFLSFFNKSLKSFKEEEEKMNAWDKHLKSMSYKKRRKYLAKLGKEDYKLSADKVVFVDPQFIYVNHKGVELINSEKRQYQFYDQLENAASSAKMSQVTLSPKFNSGFTGEMLSDMGNFKQWLYEKGIHTDNLKDIPFVCSENEYIKYLSEKYNTDYFAYSAIVRSKEKRRGKLLYIVAGIYVPFIMPLMLAKVFTPKYSSYYYTAVFNVNSGNFEFERGYSFDYRVNKGHLNSAIYDNLVEMSKEKKIK